MKRGGPLERRTRLERGNTPIAPRRKKPRRQNRELEEAGEERENDFSPETRAIVRQRSGGRCEWTGCDKPATEMHHRKLRRYGDHRPVNALHLCLWHHDQIEDQPTEAYRCGLSVRSTLDPASLTVDFAGFGLSA